MGDPLANPPARPDGLDAVRVLAIALIVWAGLPVVARLGVPHFAVALAGKGALVAVPLLYAWWARIPILRSNGLGRVPWVPLGLSFVAALGSMWLVKGVHDLGTPVFRWLGWESVTQQELQQFKESVSRERDNGTLYEVLLFVVGAPLGEEILFRGLAFRGLASRLGLLGAVALTAPLFAALHGPWLQRVVMLFLGIFWGTLAGLTGSVWPGVLAHAANNLAVLVCTGRYGDRMMEEIRAPVWVLALSATVFAGSMGLLFVEYRRRKAREGVWR